MKRRGISYVMTVTVVGTILLISGVIVMVGFSGQLDAVTAFLGIQQDQSEADLCAQRAESFCSDKEAGTSWTQRYPDCEPYASQIDTDESCPIEPPEG